MRQITIVLVGCCLAALVSPGTCRPDGPPKGHFMYLNVPGPKQYEAGHHRGNKHHMISRFEQAKDHRFRTRVKWSDARDGYGEHYIEFNHSPSVHHDDAGAGGYGFGTHHPHQQLHHRRGPHHGGSGGGGTAVAAKLQELEESEELIHVLPPVTLSSYDVRPARPEPPAPVLMQGY